MEEAKRAGVAHEAYRLPADGSSGRGQVTSADAWLAEVVHARQSAAAEMHGRGRRVRRCRGLRRAGWTV